MTDAIDFLRRPFLPPAPFQKARKSEKLNNATDEHRILPAPNALALNRLLTVFPRSVAALLSVS
jgi:hypothetical protein